MTTLPDQKETSRTAEDSTAGGPAASPDTDLVDRLAHPSDDEVSAKDACQAQLARHDQYIAEHLQDMPEVRDWSLGDWAEKG